MSIKITKLFYISKEYLLRALNSEAKICLIECLDDLLVFYCMTFVEPMSLYLIDL